MQPRPFPAAEKAWSDALLSSLWHSKETFQVWKSGNSCSLGKDIQAHIYSPLPLFLTPRNKKLVGSPILDK